MTGLVRRCTSFEYYSAGIVHIQSYTSFPPTGPLPAARAVSLSDTPPARAGDGPALCGQIDGTDSTNERRIDIHDWSCPGQTAGSSSEVVAGELPRRLATRRGG